MQSRVPARVAGHSLVAATFFPPQKLVVALSLVGQIVFAAYILSWTLLVNPCSFVERRY